MDIKRTAVKPPKWGYYPGIPDGAVIEVGPRRHIYDVDKDKPLLAGTNARRDVYLDGVVVGFIEQYTHTTSVTRGRIRYDTGSPTEWVIDGENYWCTYKQMNEAVYALVDLYLAKQKREGKR